VSGACGVGRCAGEPWEYRGSGDSTHQPRQTTRRTGWLRFLLSPQHSVASVAASTNRVTHRTTTHRFSPYCPCLANDVSIIIQPDTGGHDARMIPLAFARVVLSVTRGFRIPRDRSSACTTSIRARFAASQSHTVLSANTIMQGDHP